MRIILLLALAIAFWSCNPTNTVAPSGPVMDTTGYDLTDTPGGLQYVTKKDENGNLLENGYLENGVKQGTWSTYTSAGPFPKTTTSYVNGNYHGLYLSFNDRGQVELIASYRDNKLHGHWGKYRFGRPEESANYKDGELDGVYTKYFPRDGKIQTTIEYKDGVQDGYYRFFNEEGQITLEYLYKNGEKVSGGIVTPEEGSDNPVK